MPDGAEGQPGGSVSVEEKTSNLWSLLPSFDPSVDSAKEYADKVKFLWGICPVKDRSMLAPRLALQCKGTAWSQVRAIDASKLTDPETGYKVLLKALETWEDAEELQTFDKFEKAFYRVVQKTDESAMSFVNRINVAFEEVGSETTVQQVRAFVMLRQSALTVEDKKRVVSMAGNYDPSAVEKAMRSLSTKVLGQTDAGRKKVYPANFVEEELDEIHYAAEEECDEEQALAMLIEEGDETALAIQEFEDQVIHVCQDSPELAMAFSTYQEARQKLRDKFRSRGFWPLRHGKGKGKNKSKKGKGPRKYQSLAERIASSTCRACGARGHWKDECPLKDKNVTADANVILTEELSGGGELLDELPGHDLANWQVGMCSKFWLPTMVPPEYHVDNEEFSLIGSHEMILHAINIPKGKSCCEKSLKYFPKLKEMFRRAIETSFSVTGRSPESTEESRNGSLGDSGTGIIDTGASKSVIGEKRVSALLTTLKAEHREMVKWKESETVFRFGNNGVLKSVGALFVPFGKQWMKIEVVRGTTPFLISNAFLHALGADVLVSKSCLEVSSWGKSVTLTRNAKGLFIVKLSDLIDAASMRSNSEKFEEVITLASSRIENRSREVYCTHKQQQQPNTMSSTSSTTATAAVAQPQVDREPDRLQSQSALSQADSHDSSKCLGNAISGTPDRDARCDAVRRSGCLSGLRRSTTTRDQKSSPSRCDDLEGVGSVEVPGREVAAQVLLSGIPGGPKVRQVHEGAQETGVSLGTEFSGLRGSHGQDAGRLLEGLLPGVCQTVGQSRDVQDVSEGRDREESRTRVGAVDRRGDIASDEHDVITKSEAPHGRRAVADGDRGAAERGDDHSHGDLAARDGQDQGRLGGSLNERSSVEQLETDQQLTNQLLKKIELAMGTIEAELTCLQKIWPTLTDSQTFQKFGSDLLEIYCEEHSQITEQACKLGLKARRFTFSDGDLSTPEGQAALWKVLEEERPREVWMAPECKYWGNFSRRNMGRSKSTEQMISEGRKKQRVHLKLCNDVYWYQMDCGGQFHLEQPQGSELIYQPEVYDIYCGTLCTVFDMCEVGKLLAPHVMRRVSGNNFLRKRTHVYTSSKIFHDAFDHRLCPGHHKHAPIAGKIYHLGRWISLSEYAARYTSGFGRNVARYVSCRFDEKPLVLDELHVCDVDEAFVAGVVKRKRVSAAAVPESLEEPVSAEVKRPRYHCKQTPAGDHGCAAGEYWDGIFKKIETMVPRVGKRVLDDDGVLAQIQKGAPNLKVQRVEACRGTERLRLPGADADPETIPLRLTVVKDRITGQSMVLGPAEEWAALPKRQQIRKGQSAKMSLTIFGSFPKSGELETMGSDKEAGTGDDGEDVVVVSKDPPKNVPVHGPGYMLLNGDEKAQIRRLHHNLGHPHPQKFAWFLKERHAEPHLVQGALDYQCDSCAETKAGPDSTRPGTIHENLGFNQVIGMDTAVWTNSVGKNFQFSHIIDEGTLFHVGSHVVSADTDSQIRVFEKCWMLWAGTPQVVYVDPGTEYTAEAWQDRMQRHDIHVKVSASEAHWQLGRVEIHGSVVKKMLSRMDLESPINSVGEFEQALVHVFNAKNSLSRVKGYSPEQAVLGIAKRLPGSVVSSQGVGSITLAEGTGPESEAFRASLERRSSARRAFIEADNSSSLRRALLRRTRPMRGPFEIGDLVLYWRRRGANLRRDRGRWYGPASVVAVEGSKNVWLNHAGKLVRTSPEQLRAASFREWKQAKELLTESGPGNSDLQRALNDGSFIDVDGEDFPDWEAETEGYDPSIGEPEGELSVQPPGTPNGELSNQRMNSLITCVCRFQKVSVSPMVMPHRRASILNQRMTFCLEMTSPCLQMIGVASSGRLKFLLKTMKSMHCFALDQQMKVCCW